MSPLKIFESMAARKPIVCSDLPVLREILRHKETGWLAPPDDPEGWVSALRTLERDEGLRRALGDRAREELVREYTWDHRVQRLLSAYVSA